MEDFKRILAGAGTDLAAMRRRVTRLLCDDLDTLEDFHHLTRREPPSLSREGAPIAWVDPAGRELAAYNDCAAAAREWGLPESAVADCVYGRTPAANGLRFDYRGVPPPRSSCVRDGVYRLPNGRFRVQLGLGTTPRKVPPRSWPTGSLGAAWPCPQQSGPVPAASVRGPGRHARSVCPVVRGNGLRRRALPSARSPDWQKILSRLS